MDTSTEVYRGALEREREISADAAAECKHLRVAVDQTMAARNELQRRLDDILDLIDGRIDVDDGEDGRQVPNIFMQISQIAQGTDRP